MTEPAIAIADLQKTYAGGKRALDHVSLDVPRGQIFGLLGPNGAGKSTFMRILAGVLEPTSGSVTLEGRDVLAEPSALWSVLGLVAAFLAAAARAANDASTQNCYPSRPCAA